MYVGMYVSASVCLCCVCVCIHTCTQTHYIYVVVPCRQVGSLDLTDAVLLKEVMRLKDGIDVKCDQLAVEWPLCLFASSWFRSLPKHLRHLLYTIMGIPRHHIARS